MELFQVFRDNQKNLFCQFKKSEEEKLKILPETVKRVNIRFEINRRDACLKNPPSLISIKNFYFFKDFIIFTIDLNEIFDLDGLIIKILHLTVFLQSNKRIEISVDRKFELSEICLDKDFNLENGNENFFTQERIYRERKTDYKKNKQKDTFIYEKNQLKKISQNNIIMATIRENNKRLKNIENQLETVNTTLKNISFNNFNYVSQDPPRRGAPQRGIERIKKVNGPISNLALKPPGYLYFLPELKTLVNNSERFKNFLKPMSKEELSAITLDDDELNEKQIDLFNRQKESTKVKQTKQIKLKNLKIPK
ncbi:MAG: hypothetical protein ACFFDO_08225 [Candidatus Thorarchaeota archaeon]